MKEKWFVKMCRIFRKTVLLVCALMIMSDTLILSAFGVDKINADGTIYVWKWTRFDVAMNQVNNGQRVTNINRKIASKTLNKNDFTRILLYRDGYYSIKATDVVYKEDWHDGISNEDDWHCLPFYRCDNPYIDRNATAFTTGSDLEALYLSNDGGTNEWIIKLRGGRTLASDGDTTDTFNANDSWEDGDKGFQFNNRGNGYVRIRYRADDDEHDNGWYMYDGFVICDSCKYAGQWNTDDFLCYLGYEETFSAITADKEIKNQCVLNINDQVFLQGDNFIPTITVNSGGIVTVEGRFYLNGKIVLNGGTLIVNEGASMAPFDPPNNSNVANIVINGGDLIIMKGGSVCLGRDCGVISLTNGGSVVNNGRVVLPHGFTNKDSTFINNQSGGLWVGYYMNAGLGGLSEKKVNQDANGKKLLDGLSAVSGSVTAKYEAGDNVKASMLNEGYARVSRSDMVSGGNLGNTSSTGNAETMKKRVDQQREAYCKTRDMGQDAYRELFLKPAYETAQTVYDAMDPDSTQAANYLEKTLAPAKENYTVKYAEMYQAYLKTVQQEAIEAYPYINDAIVGTAHIG